MTAGKWRQRRTWRLLLWCTIFGFKNQNIRLRWWKRKKPSSIRGRLTCGCFQDGGGAKVDHCDNLFKFVPGTGGGSTSIKISSNSLFSRVIVADGGGGASGSSYDTNDGEYGGGTFGGNSHCGTLLRNEGT